MYASTTFNLFDVVDNATSITFRSGQTQPTGSSISGGVFTIGTAGGTAYFTATNANGSTHFEIAIDVVSVDPDNFSDTFRYRTEIAGIDVTQDVKGTPTVSESIDEVRLNVVTANRVNLTLRSDSTNDSNSTAGLLITFGMLTVSTPTGSKNRLRCISRALSAAVMCEAFCFQVGSMNPPRPSAKRKFVSVRETSQHACALRWHPISGHSPSGTL